MQVIVSVQVQSVARDPARTPGKWRIGYQNLAGQAPYFFEQLVDEPQATFDIAPGSKHRFYAERQDSDGVAFGSPLVVEATVPQGSASVDVPASIVLTAA